MIPSSRARVALESTLISHGLPWPDNLETALASEAAVRDSDAEPLTIGVIGGSIRVGLTRAEVEHLAHAPSGTVIKAGRRDLASAVARSLDAATTVSATVWIARTHGIAVMATGGLGGVHRGAAATFDISADLDELARADGVVVVCSGVKSILDIPATLERLETSGVTVVGYGTDEFPAFTTSSSGLPLETRCNTPADVAELVQAHRRLALPGAIVVAQPPPVHLALPRHVVESAIVDATREAQDRGITGKALTPFLLDAVRTATDGRSLVVNKALIVANARLAGQIAQVLASA
jgi:pseudouridine-5'-phosphate glycosidase